MLPVASITTNKHLLLATAVAQKPSKVVLYGEGLASPAVAYPLVFTSRGRLLGDLMCRCVCVRPFSASNMWGVFAEGVGLMKACICTMPARSGGRSILMFKGRGALKI